MSLAQVDLEAARPTLYDVFAMERFRKRRGLHPNQIRKMRYAFYQMHEREDAALARLGTENAALIRSEFKTSLLSIDRQFRSEQDGSTKLVFKTTDDYRFETILLRAKTGRTTVCVSTQVGCDAGCPFCATSRMGLNRQLTADEILEQVLTAARYARLENRRLRNVVFMGMGEPLHNEDALHSALTCLRDQQWFAFPGHRLVVSTVGVPDAMRRLVESFPDIQFALSLHSAKPELRAKLIPWSRNHSWDELAGAVRYISEIQAKLRRPRPLMIEHLLLDGVNDGAEDADALIQYICGLNVYVNLIPFNPFPNGPNWRPSPKPTRERFAIQLRQAGFFTTVRYSMGSDIQAACGQLVQP